MSLLNDVLRDLDARRADAVAGPDLQREIRPLPPARETSAFYWRWVLLAVVGMVLAGALVWWLTRETPAPVAPPQAVAAPAVVAVPVAPPAAQLPAPVAAPDTPVPPAPAEPLVPEPLLRPAMELQSLPSEPVRPEKAASVPPEPDKPTKTVATPPPGARTGTPPVAVGSRETMVEKKAVLTTPRERADAELSAAQSLLAQGKAGDALESARLAMRHDAAYAPARQLALKILLDQKRHDEAIQLLNDGLEIQPAQIAWAMTLARLQLEKNDASAAERTLSRSWGPGAGNAAYAGFYGHVRSRLGQHREAADLYQTATRLAPAEGRWWFGLASSLEQLGRQGEARAAYRQAHESGNLPPSLAAITEQRLGARPAGSP